jgi:threonine dehydratase
VHIGHLPPAAAALMCTTGADMSAPIPTEAIERARKAICDVAIRTPLVAAASLSTRCAREVRLKLETAQPIGAFKIRGAANALAIQSENARARGVACSSTGNHGRAVAYAAARLGLSATVCMSSLVPENKLAAIRALGAEVRIVGNSQVDTQREVDRLAAENGVIDIPPFDNPDVIAGQATIGAELIEDWRKVDTVVVPLSGGGLIAGIASAVKTASPSTRIVGVSMDRGAAMKASLDAGHPVDVAEQPTLADALAGGIGLDNRWTFAIVRELVDEVVLVSEEQIAAAMRTLFFEEGWVAEGAGAIGTALLSKPHVDLLGKRVAIVVSGKNIDMRRFHEIVGTAPKAQAS